jgi:hypothetical protein
MRFFRLADGGAGGGDDRFLALQVLLLLDALALLVGVHEAPGEAVLRQLLERALLLVVVRQHLQQLAAHRFRRGQVVARLFQHAVLLRERVAVGAHVRGVLRSACANTAAGSSASRRSGRATAARRRRRSAMRLVWKSVAQRAAVGVGERGVHAHQDLPLLHALAFAHQDFLHHALLRRLHDLQVARRHQLALGDGDDVEPGELPPITDNSHEQKNAYRTARPERRWRAALRLQQRGLEIGWISFEHSAAAPARARRSSGGGRPAGRREPGAR